MTIFHLLALLVRAVRPATLTLPPPDEASLHRPLSKVLLWPLTRPLKPASCAAMLRLIDRVDGGPVYHRRILAQHRPVCGVDLAVLRRADKAQRSAVPSPSPERLAMIAWEAQRDAAYPPCQREKDRRAMAKALAVWQVQRDAAMCRRLNGGVERG